MGRFIKGLLGCAAVAAAGFITYNLFVPPKERAKIKDAVNSVLDMGEHLINTPNTQDTEQEKRKTAENQASVQKQWIELGL